MKKKINSLVELKAEIAYLKVKKADQEGRLKERFSSPAKAIGALFSVFKSEGSGKFSLHDYIPQDLITLLTRVALPSFLNAFVFKKSGLLTKFLVTFASQKAAKKVNADVVTDWFDNALSWVKDKINVPKTQKVRPPVLRDYGIPPDSETY